MHRRERAPTARRQPEDRTRDRTRGRDAARLHAPAVVLFLSFLDVFALLPTIAPHVESLGAGPLGIGVTVAAYSAANLPANVVGGILIDRRGRRPVLIAGLLLAAAAVAAYPLAASVPTLVLVRLAHGIAGGLLVPAVFAVAGDRVRRDQAGRAFGRLGAVIGLAAVVAPAAAGIVRQAAGTEVVFLGVAGALAIGALVTFLAIRDTPTGRPPVHAPSAVTPTTPPPASASHPGPATKPATTPAAASALRSWLPVIDSAPLRRGLIATVALTWSVGVLAAFLPGVAETAGADASTVGGLFTTYALVAGGVMLSPLAGRIDRSATSRVAAGGLLVLAVALVWLAVATQLWALVVGSAVFGAGYGLVFPAVAGATSAATGRATRGRAFGLFNAAFSLGIAAGPPTVGLLVQTAPSIDPFAATAVGTVLVAGALGWRSGPRGGS